MSVEAVPVVEQTGPTFGAETLVFARTVAACVWAGALTGILVGGIGSRLAMRVLFLTSGDGVRGIESDDGFIIGRFNIAATMNLVLTGFAFGVLGGLLYLWTRRYLPSRLPARSLVTGLFGAVVIGALLVHTDGVDFTRLSPRGLAIALFMLVPGLAAALVVPLAERFDRPGSFFHSRPPVFALAPFLLLVFPLGPVIGPVLALVLAVRLVGRSVPDAARFWQSPLVLWGGRAVVLTVFGAGALDLVRDAGALL